MLIWQWKQQFINKTYDIDSDKKIIKEKPIFDREYCKIPFFPEFSFSSVRKGLIHDAFQKTLMLKLSNVEEMKARNIITLMSLLFVELS